MAWEHTASATARGYGADWRRVRAAKLSRDPLCEYCAALGRTTAAAEVDHVKPFSPGGVIDHALRLDPANLKSTCKPCHATKTARGDAPPKGNAQDGTPHDPAHAWAGGG